MKNISKLFLVMLMATVFAACSSTKDTSGSDIDSTANLNEAGTDTTNRNLNTPAGPTALTSGNVQTTAPDTVNAVQFIQEAGAAGMKEVELSKLAQQKATNQGVKAYATMMVNDHGKANDELKTLASSRNVALGMSKEATAAASALNKLNGTEFDKAYLKTMTDDHTNAIDLFDMGTRSSDPEIKAYAAKYLPSLKTHLKQVTALTNP